MSRKITIFCDGGLGNRMGTLIGGLIIAQRLNLKVHICWPVNNWCACKFEDLFLVTNFTVCESTVNEIFISGTNNIFVIHENQTGHDLGMVYGHSLLTLDTIANRTESIVYYHTKIDPQFDTQSVIESLQQIVIQPKLLAQVNEFVNTHKINKSVVGLHLRKTDNTKLDEDKFFKQAQNSKNQYFICSDDQVTEERFEELPNVVRYVKTEYAGKLVDGGWLDKTTDTNGRVYNYNVNRPRQSVIEAFIDLLILSRTSISYTVKSSFSRLAVVYSYINL